MPPDSPTTPDAPRTPRPEPTPEGPLWEPSVTGLIARLAEGERTRERMRAELLTLRGELAVSEARAVALERISRVADQRIRELVSRSDRAAVRIGELERELEDARRQVARARVELEASEDDRAELAAQLAELAERRR